MPVDGGLFVDVDLVWLLIDFLVVFDVGVDGGSIVSGRHIETLLQLYPAYRIYPDGHVGAVVANGRVFRDQIQLGRLYAVDRFVPQVRDRPSLRKVCPAAAEANCQEALKLRIVFCSVYDRQVFGVGLKEANDSVPKLDKFD